MSPDTTTTSRRCGPPLETKAGVVLTPDVILKRFEECKLMDETPSLELDSVIVACEGNLDQVFFVAETEGCEALARVVGASSRACVSTTLPACRFAGIEPGRA